MNEQQKIDELFEQYLIEHNLPADTHWDTIPADVLHQLQAAAITLLS